jgi:Helicase conserved C-terminal domain
MEAKARTFKVHRAFPVDVFVERMKREVVEACAPFTCRRAKEDCLDLPAKVKLRRSYPPSAKVLRMMESLIEDDRVVLEGGRAVVPANVLEERLRVLELTGGWIEGVPVHSDKLALLRDTIDELRENSLAPVLVWASRTPPLLASALVAAGVGPDDAQRKATAACTDASLYRPLVMSARSEGVGVIHGPTPQEEREEVQAAWRAGDLWCVVAHPGVAGAGLNWQHVKASVYYDQPLGMITRQQSEDRVHRHGLKHQALYYDLTMEDGPDEAVADAHDSQRDAELGLLSWLADKIDEISGVSDG